MGILEIGEEDGQRVLVVAEMYVIVIGCNQGLIPAARSIKEGTVEEERRLFYVAMTRSKEFLFLTRYKEAFAYDGIRPQVPSCFLREIESAYIRKA